MKNVMLVAITLVLVCVFVGLIIGIVVTDKPNYNNPIGTNLNVGLYYALTTKVVEVDRDNDIVTCEDYNGNLWEFYGDEDWEVGDCASLIMESHGTKRITDDTIEDVQYSAWTLTH